VIVTLHNYVIGTVRMLVRTCAPGASLKTLKSQFSHKPKRTFLPYADVLKRFNRVLGNLTVIDATAGANMSSSRALDAFRELLRFVLFLVVLNERGFSPDIIRGSPHSIH
jgi:hypothetical protein